MSRKTDAWMPLWIGDYLADTQHLTRDEHGAYLLMLMAYWRNGGPLADDDRRLAAIVKASSKEWKALRPVLADFFTVADGVWCQKRVEAELSGSIERAEKAASKAKKAAEARWKQSQNDAPSNAPSMQQALHKECPSPSPSPNTSSLRSEVPPRKRSATPQVARPDDVAEQTWTDWLALRKAKKAPVTETVLEQAKRESEKADMPLDAFLQVWCARGSQGLQADWLKPAERARYSQPIETFRERDERLAREKYAEWTGKSPASTVIDITPSVPFLEIEQ